MTSLLLLLLLLLLLPFPPLAPFGGVGGGVATETSGLAAALAGRLERALGRNGRKGILKGL